MLPVSLTSLIILAVLMGTQIWRPRLLLRYAKWAHFISVFFVFFIASYQTIQQYRIWQASGLFIKYSDWALIKTALHYGFTNFFLNALMALVVSGLGWLGLRFLNRRAGERFFEKPEPYLFAVGLFLCGHPGWIIYALGVFGLAVLIATIKFVLTRRRGVIFSFYWLWLPVAILGILSRTLGLSSF